MYDKIIAIGKPCNRSVRFLGELTDCCDILWLQNKINFFYRSIDLTQKIMYDTTMYNTLELWQADGICNRRQPE